jgi:hypothetical protein
MDLHHFVFDDRALVLPDHPHVEERREEPGLRQEVLSSSQGEPSLNQEMHSLGQEEPSLGYEQPGLTVSSDDSFSLVPEDYAHNANPSETAYTRTTMLSKETSSSRQSQLSAVLEEGETEVLGGTDSSAVTNEPLPETKPSLSFAEALALAQARENGAAAETEIEEPVLEPDNGSEEISPAVNEPVAEISSLADEPVAETITSAFTNEPVNETITDETLEPADGAVGATDGAIESADETSASANEAATTAGSLAHADAFRLRQQKKLERTASQQISASHVPSIAGFSRMDPFSALYETDQFVPLSQDTDREPSLSRSVASSSPAGSVSLDVDVEEEEIRSKKFRVMPDSPAARLSQAFQSTRESLQPASRRSSFLPSVARNSKSAQLFGGSTRRDEQ